MSAEHVAAAAETLLLALGPLLLQAGLTPLSDNPAAASATGTRIGHLLETDPGGSWVAREGSQVVGFTQAARRDDCWVLAHLFVRPGQQSAGVGAVLLEHAHDYGRELSSGIIGATADPRAIRKYARLPGFHLYPAVVATGALALRELDPRPASIVRDGSLQDQHIAAGIDVGHRGGAHGPDLAFLLTQGFSFRVVPDRGYAVGNDHSLTLLAANDREAATALLTDALLRMHPGDAVELPRLTGEQQWAFPVITSAGLGLRPWGPLLMRNRERAPSPYLPQHALG